MDSKAGKIIIAASGVVAAGAALWYIWKKFIDVDDEEEEESKEEKTEETQQTEEKKPVSNDACSCLVLA